MSGTPEFSPDEIRHHRGFFYFEEEDINLSTIGERIKRIRKLHKYSQVEFAKIIGVSQGTLSELEQDKYKPALDTVKDIHIKFETDIYWLLYGMDKTQHVNYNKGISEFETELILEFRKLKEIDQDEIVEFIKLKIKRYVK